MCTVFSKGHSMNTLGWTGFAGKGWWLDELNKKGRPKWSREETIKAKKKKQKDRQRCQKG